MNRDTAVLKAFASAAKVHGITVTLRRGGLATAGVTAVPGGMTAAAALARGIDLTTEHTAKDFIVKAANYAFDGDAVEPARGDVIEETIGEDTVSWTVVPKDDGRKCFDWSDPGRQLIRVHAKQLSAPVADWICPQ